MPNMCHNFILNPLKKSHPPKFTAAIQVDYPIHPYNTYPVVLGPRVSTLYYLTP